MITIPYEAGGAGELPHIPTDGDIGGGLRAPGGFHAAVCDREGNGGTSTFEWWWGVWGLGTENRNITGGQMVMYGDEDPNQQQTVS